MYRLEVIATTLHDAIEAQAGGASSLEIIENLSVGGLTPRLNLVRAIRDTVNIDMHVMVRPHAAGFVYSPQEAETILRQTEEMTSIGVTSVVFGALTREGEVNLRLVQQVSRIAGRLTFHRALDETNDPETALLALRGTAERVLCSGGAYAIWDGRQTMSNWVQAYSGNFSFVCAGGITLENLPRLAQITQAQEYHVGSAARMNGVVDRERVSRLVRILNS